MITPACCNRQTICNMDHRKGDLTPMVNRCCTRCWRHWYGPVGAVREYTRQQWDAWINAAFDVDLAAAT